jgi:hypothetical protein
LSIERRNTRFVVKKKIKEYAMSHLSPDRKNIEIIQKIVLGTAAESQHSCHKRREQWW